MQKRIDTFIARVAGWKQNETPRAYRSKLKRLVDYFHDKPPNKIKLKDLEAFKLHLLNSGLSPWTIKTVLMTVRHFFKWLYESHRIRTNPAKDLRIPNPPPPEPKAIAPATFEAMLINAQASQQPERDTALLLCLRDTGCRISGIASLKLDKLDLASRRAEVKEKGKANIVYVSPITIRALKRWLKVRAKLEARSTHLFISGKTGKGLTRSGIHQLLNRLARDALGRHNAHSFRHAFARDWLKRGGNLSTLSEILHHSTIVITATYYARWDDGELKEAHAKYSPLANSD